MKIYLSKYYRPFVEPSSPGVHFISKDDQIDMRLGFYDAHVKCFMEQPSSITDPLTGRIYHHNPRSPHLFSSPLVKNSDANRDFLEDLYFNSGIKAAGARLGRVDRRFGKPTSKVEIS